MSDLDFDGRVAVVTGAGGGLGRQHALLLASRGAQVVVNDLGGGVDGHGSSTDPAQAVVDEITAAGGAAVADTNTVVTPEGAEAIVATALEAFGRLDVVVNNAGILRDKSFANMTPDLWDRVLAVHLSGTMHVTRAAWPQLQGQGYGRVVNTSSAAGIFGNFGQANYGAAKMGIVGLTRVLAQEGKKHNIGVNAIAPVARTRMTEELLGPLAAEVDPALVSPVVAWLAHEDCPATGELFSVCGGRVAQIFIGETPGFFKPDLALEDVRDHFEEIRTRDGYFVPTSARSELKAITAQMPAGSNHA
jgi:NAD(P)-dependent dehydrogenase (short-subunit alcohol dehydrogenase family)